MKTTHKKGMPFGWVSNEGKSMPVFICSVTGKPISPDNPGTLYWNPDSGETIVLSDSGENDLVEAPSSDYYSIELDVFSSYLFANTVGPDRTKAMSKAIDYGDL